MKFCKFCLGLGAAVPWPNAAPELAVFSYKLTL
jgi:hypothetical protein